MDKIIRPEKFNTPPSATSSCKHWKIWLRNFNYFLTTIDQHKPDKLEVLFVHVGTNVVDIIQDCKTYEEAMKALNAAYIKPPNEIYARHMLSTRTQKPEETTGEFLLCLNNLASDCSFKAVTAEEIVRNSSVTLSSEACDSNRYEPDFWKTKP